MRRWTDMFGKRLTLRKWEERGITLHRIYDGTFDLMGAPSMSERELQLIGPVGTPVRKSSTSTVSLPRLQLADCSIPCDPLLQELELSEVKTKWLRAEAALKKATEQVEILREELRISQEACGRLREDIICLRGTGTTGKPGGENEREQEEENRKKREAEEEENRKRKEDEEEEEKRKEEEEEKRREEEEEEKKRKEEEEREKKKRKEEEEREKRKRKKRRRRGRRRRNEKRGRGRRNVREKGRRKGRRKKRRRKKRGRE